MWDANGTPIGSFDTVGSLKERGHLHLFDLLALYRTQAFQCAEGADPRLLDDLHKEVQAAVRELSRR